ncbi:MAG: DUF362 domain-containing protein [bacterium]
MSSVAVLKTTPQTVLDDYRKLFKMADLENHLDKSKPVILKDNISWHFPYPGANTTPWQLEAVIMALKESGYKDIICVQNKTVVINPYLGERLNKYTEIFQKYNIPVLFNFKKTDMKWSIYKPKAEMLVLDKIFPKGILIPDYFHGKNIVHLPTVKCHIYSSTTGSMKNAFGGLLNTKRHYTHSVIHETLVDLLNIQKEIHAGIFNVMDGTTCGNGPGPRIMKPEEKDYILASGDCVAIDAVAAKMMGFDPINDLKFIRLGHEKGLGCGDINKIKIIGEDIKDVNFNFSVGATCASKIGQVMWFGPFKFFQKLFFHTPLVYLFIFGSYAYHDLYWYNFTGKKVVRNWMETTKWGKLFKSYPGTEEIS